MGVLDRVRSAFALPVVSPARIPVGSPWADSSALTRITLADLFPTADPNLWPVTPAQAMSVPAVAAAYLRIVGTLSRLPLRAVDSTGQSWTAQVGLLTTPDPGVPRTTIMRDTFADIYFHGLAYWGVTATYATDARPLDVVHVPVGLVDVDNLGRPTVSTAYQDWLRQARGVQVLLDGQHLLRFDGPVPGGMCCIGQTAIRAALRLEKSALTTAENPVPAIELHQTTDDDMNDTEIDELLAGWTDGRRRYGVAWTNSAIETKTHGVAPEQLLVEGRNQSAVDIARLSGIPAASIDAALTGSGLTYANLVDRVRDLINLGLQNYAVPFCSRLSMDDVVPRGVVIQFDYSELYPPAAATAAPDQAAPTAVQPAGATA